jgi:phospholipase/lecithinase/hemolysin
MLNELLPSEFENLESQLGITIFQDDFFGLIQEIIADPSAFGLENATDSAGKDPSKAGAYLYWDDYHFTTAGHRILADSAAAAIPEPPTVLISLIGIALLLPRRLTAHRTRTGPP